MSPWGAARELNANQPHQHHQHRNPGQLMLIMTIGLLPAACRTQWNQEFTALERTGGFMAFQLVRRIRDRDADGAGVS